MRVGTANQLATHTSMPEPTVQHDPLGSPHPIPWRWVLALQAEAHAAGTRKAAAYRSPALISPDQSYAAYSRIQVQAAPEFTQCRISSTLFVENLKTRDLQTIVPQSPLAEHPLANPEAPTSYSGTAAMLIPISWTQDSDRLLTRDFEALLGSDFASDYAVIWERSGNQTFTLAPGTILYSHAILLGWSKIHPGQVLFRAGSIGEIEWPQWRVDFSGRTQAAVGDHPQTFGQVTRYLWSGTQN
jgi:hypothetical protein